jgi:hypothetical protein
MVLDPGVGQRHSRGQIDVQHVVGVTTVGVDAVAIPDRRDVGALTDDALCEQKSLRQFHIGARCASSQRAVLH